MIKQNIQSKYKYKENVMETKTNKLNAWDFIFIGIFAAVALLIFFIRAEALIPPMLCVVIKGIKADCNHLIRTTYPDALRRGC